MARKDVIEQLVAFIDAARATDKATHINLYLQLTMQAHPIQFTATSSDDTLVSSSSQPVERVYTAEHEIPEKAADSIGVAQALLDELKESMTESLFD